MTYFKMYGIKAARGCCRNKSMFSSKVSQNRMLSEHPRKLFGLDYDYKVLTVKKLISQSKTALFVD